jgi:hypothetical protein
MEILDDVEINSSNASDLIMILVLLRAKKVGHQTSVSFEKFNVVQALLSFCL